MTKLFVLSYRQPFSLLEHDSVVGVELRGLGPELLPVLDDCIDIRFSLQLERQPAAVTCVVHQKVVTVRGAEENAAPRESVRVLLILLNPLLFLTRDKYLQPFKIGAPESTQFRQFADQLPAQLTRQIGVCLVQ